MDISNIIVLVLFGLFGLACFWSGARVATKEPIIESKPTDVELETVDFMGKDLDE